MCRTVASTNGRCSRNRARAPGKNELVRGLMLPTISLPLSPFAASCACAIACVAAASTRRPPRRKARPASVSSTPREFLSKSLRPSSSSRSLICRLNAGKPRAKGKKSLVRWLALSVVILGVIAGVWYWLFSSQFEETDDAYVTGHEHPVSFRVAGTISEVLVDDNQLVTQGQPIAQLDPKDFQVALAQSKPSLEQARV